MTLDSLTFDTVLERLQHTSSLPIKVLWGPAGPCISNICFCPQIRTLWMQCMDLPYLETLVTESRFQPNSAILEQVSPTTCILINFLSNADYTDIEHVHIGLIVIHQGFHPCKQKDILPFLDVIQGNLQATCKKELRCGHKLPMPHSFCLLTANFGRLLAMPIDPPYCLVYPMEFSDSTLRVARDHCHPKNTLHTLPLSSQKHSSYLMHHMHQGVHLLPHSPLCQHVTR